MRRLTAGVAGQEWGEHHGNDRPGEAAADTGRRASQAAHQA
ncbi:MAG TPA: hypothetical protein VMV92_07080 [Streptosporangiaceae bacterium]|nr:hypothetical protein [Streptosporangiaceae bacterium]